jgi:MFS superfamily sulfate permease-like transporter
MKVINRRAKFYILSFLKYDFKASITVFFVALPLCLGISLASGAPVYSGIISGIVGGMVVSLFSRSELSVSGPAAGLTAICAAAIIQLGSIETFFIAVAVAGLLQILLGALKLGGFTNFIPSAVIKGMLSAIGILLISKQIPLLIGYDQPGFWTDQLFNILTFNHSFEHLGNLYNNISTGAIVIVAISFIILFIWEKYFAAKIPLPSSFVLVFIGVLMSLGFRNFYPPLQLENSQFVNVPSHIFSNIKLPNLSAAIHNIGIWRNAVLICFVASLETLLSIEAIDKLDPYNRITPQNRELIAQGVGNAASGLLGGLPITAVIVRSSANLEAGAKTRLSAFVHGLWLLLVILFATSIINLVPYCVLAVILVRTGYNLAKPKMIYAVYKQGREQFMPFIVTVVAILFTDLLIGVLIGVVYAIYFLIKHTYRAGFVMKETVDGLDKHFTIELALNVSFLNKKRIIKLLDHMPNNSIVEIIGTDSVYIDRDILEIFQDFKSKAHNKNIRLLLRDIPEVETIEMH